MRPHARRHQVPALHAQPIEVISQGEVADVEEVEGIRLLTDIDQKRPIVQYLIKWKVRTQSQSRLGLLLFHLLQPRSPVQASFDALLGCLAGWITAHMVGDTPERG